MSKLLNELEEINIREFVKSEYKVYQHYSLMDRALPFYLDGLKPVHRRILYTFFKNKSKGLTKVASAAGQVLSLHPHGNKSVEDAIVNLAQDYTFSNNYPLLEKKGYFGERMETQAAAPRYIEAKLAAITEAILFDDMNQVELIKSYDEKNWEPKYLLPKIPLMLINGTEGIGSGFSCMIPSFHHKDVIDSMINYIKTKKTKKIKPWYNYHTTKVSVDRETGKYVYPMVIEKKGTKYHITELPKGFDKNKLAKHLDKLIDQEKIKDYVDNCVRNDIDIELVFKKGSRLTLEEVYDRVYVQSYLTPNYTTASETGVLIFDNAEEIIKVFTEHRINVVKRRYHLLVEDLKKTIQYNNEIIRFIKEKHYQQAEKKKNRQDFISYLNTKKFFNKDKLADLAVYRMTKEEINKRELLVKEESSRLKEYSKILKSKKLIESKLIEELEDVKRILSDYLNIKNRGSNDFSKIDVSFRR